MDEISNLFVICMGIGTVFIGLISIIIMCKLVSFFCNIGNKDNNESAKNAEPSASANNKAIENRQEIIAAVTAVCAEEMGKDISALRVISFKKI